MDPIKPCNTYSAYPSGQAVYRNGPHVFKIYYVDITGRSQPERYEWDRCGRDRDTLLAVLAEVPIEGLGFVIAFPHVTKVFRFAPSAETIMHVRAFNTADFAEINLQREEGYVEFACYAEAIIAAEEYHTWAEATSADEYLGQWCAWDEAPVRDHTKLARYFTANR
jgi:hypothetical protein